MAEPFLQQLKAFTPNGGGIDRDALLFEMGRASVRRRRWPALAGLLAVTQVATLMLFWTRDYAPVPSSAQPALPNLHGQQTAASPGDGKEKPAAEEPLFGPGGGEAVFLASAFWTSKVAELAQAPVDNDFVSPESVWDQFELDPVVRKYLMMRSGTPGER